jgi:hypothetical protein
MSALRRSIAADHDPTRPRRGRSVAGSVSPLARKMIDAVVALKKPAASLEEFDWLAEGSRRDQILHSDPAGRAAWAVAAITCIYAQTVSKDPRCSLALSWFGDDVAAELFERTPQSQAEDILAEICGTVNSTALLPYLLDTFGPTSRLDVIRDASRSHLRSARKEVGSFYTPSDVADFMVTSVAGPIPEQEFWFDPACGSGIFLLSALKHIERRGYSRSVVEHFALHGLHGVDISPQTVDFAAFTLLAHLSREAQLVPKELWVRLRQNFIATDALKLLPAPGRNSRAALDQLFGPVSRPLKFVCNPPYVAGGDAIASKPLYLSFAEMAWRLMAHSEDSAAIVLPLAVATNRSSHHTRFRSALVEAGGDWTALFFDRQPHALFGEDVKTRTSIFISRPSNTCRIKTSRLLKWTSAQRAQIFSDDRAVDLGNTKIGRLIPKLGSADEVLLYNALYSYRLKRPGRPYVHSLLPDEIHRKATALDVFVGATAYNFLNVFRTYPASSNAPGPLSTSRVHRLTFSDAEQALAGFALMSSRMAFWLWHVEADGFHVPSWFLDEMPLFELDWKQDQHAELAALGATLWEEAKRNLLASQNGGRWTLAFRPTIASAARNSVDRIIVEALQIEPRVLRALQLFEHQITSVDGKERVGRAGVREQAIIRMLPT